MIDWLQDSKNRLLIANIINAANYLLPIYGKYYPYLSDIVNLAGSLQANNATYTSLKSLQFQLKLYLLNPPQA